MKIQQNRNENGGGKKGRKKRQQLKVSAERESQIHLSFPTLNNLSCRSEVDFQICAIKTSFVITLLVLLYLLQLYLSHHTQVFPLQ